MFTLHEVAGRGGFAFHPFKPLLAFACGDVRFRDLRNGESMNLLAGAPTDGVASVVFSPDGKWIALGMENGQVSVWDFAIGSLLYLFNEHLADVKVLRFSHDGRWLASAGNENRVVLYDVRRGMRARLEGDGGNVSGLAFAPDDKTLVSTSDDGIIRFWSVANHQVALMLTHGGGAVFSVAFAPDGDLMATSGADGTARLWPAAKLNDVIVFPKAKEYRK
jgi:WD40 repeat protein